MGRAAHAQGSFLSARIELAVGACILAIGLAGPPLDPLRMLAALLCCGTIVASGRFSSAVALGATILAGDSPDAFNDVEHPMRVVPQKVELTADDAGAVTLPPHSLTILEVALKAP